jgi:nucleoside-diphosphate-sugar epimerase
MRVVVTGGSGKVGRAAVTALITSGHKVGIFDIKPSPDGLRTTTVDCTDFGAVMGALSAIDAVGGIPDAVVHFAGIPMPGLTTDNRTFADNTLSTYNVFSACARLGIMRVVWASSETIMGMPYQVPPEFAPLDETHPDRPWWSYALSKVVGETMADSFVRWKVGMSITSLRFSNVYDSSDYANVPEIQKQTGRRKANLWAYVDSRDCGEASRLAVEKGIPGHKRLIIAAADSIMDVPTANLLAEHFPTVPVRGSLGHYQSLLSSEKAGLVLDYKSQFSWRNAA